MIDDPWRTVGGSPPFEMISPPWGPYGSGRVEVDRKKYIFCDLQIHVGREKERMVIMMSYGA